MFTDYPDVVTVEQLQEMIGIGKNTAYKLVNDGAIKSVKIGRTYKIPKCFVMDYLLTDSSNGGDTKHESAVL